jgi:hypothetical protein
MAQQGSPSAAYIEQAVARLEPELPAEILPLGRLGLVQVLLSGWKLGAGIDHLPIEPEGIEVVAEIVVVTNGSGIPLRGVTRPQSPSPG